MRVPVWLQGPHFSCKCCSSIRRRVGRPLGSTACRGMMIIFVIPDGIKMAAATDLGPPPNNRTGKGSACFSCHHHHHRHPLNSSRSPVVCLKMKSFRGSFTWLAKKGFRVAKLLLLRPFKCIRGLWPKIANQLIQETNYEVLRCAPRVLGSCEHVYNKFIWIRGAFNVVNGWDPGDRPRLDEMRIKSGPNCRSVDDDEERE